MALPTTGAITLSKGTALRIRIYDWTTGRAERQAPIAVINYLDTASSR